MSAPVRWSKLSILTAYIQEIEMNATNIAQLKQGDIVSYYGGKF